MIPSRVRLFLCKVEWVLLAIRLIPWPFNPSIALLVSLSFFLHSRSKGMILDASNDCLPCFACPPGSKFPR